MSNRPHADDRLCDLIDEYNATDFLAKEWAAKRDELADQIRNIVRRRGRGTYNGNESSIKAHDVRRLVLSNERVRTYLSPHAYNKCFVEETTIQIDGGPLLHDTEPDLGPPEVQVVQAS